MSPRTFSGWRTRQLDLYMRQISPSDTDLRAAVGMVRKELDSATQPRIVDWRLLMRWSPRISVQRIFVPPDISEPHSDSPLQTPEGTLVPSDYHEFWFGEDHQVPEPTNGFRLEFKAVLEKRFYQYVLPWLGLIGFLIGLCSFSLALWRWIGFLTKGKG